MQSCAINENMDIWTIWILFFLFSTSRPQVLLYYMVTPNQTNLLYIAFFRTVMQQTDRTGLLRDAQVCFDHKIGTKSRGTKAISIA